MTIPRAMRMLLLTGAGLILIACVTSHPVPPSPALATIQSAAECHYSFPDSTRIYLESEVDRAPQMVRPGPMDYPKDLRRHGIQGWVILRFVIDTAGTAVAASVAVDTTSDPGFGPPTLAMVRGAQFVPGLLRGRAVPVCVSQNINWKTS